jgi:hypothetical protein
MFYYPYADPTLADRAYLVTGLFDNELNLAALLSELEAKNFQEKEISIVMSDDTRDKSLKIGKGSKAVETAAGLGGITGLAGAITLGVASVTAAGATGGLNLVVAGPLLSTLAGFGGGAALGGVLGALTGANMPDYQIEFTRKHIESGHILVALRASNKDKANEVRDIFKKHNAINTAEDFEQDSLAQGGANAL